MRVLDRPFNVAKYEAAQARMAEIDALEPTPELAAERAALDGSWIEERWLEIEGVMTEAEAIEHDKAEKAKAEAHAAEKAALRAKVSALAKEPPRPQDMAQALSDLAKAVEALT